MIGSKRAVFPNLSARRHQVPASLADGNPYFCTGVGFLNHRSMFLFTEAPKSMSEKSLIRLGAFARRSPRDVLYASESIPVDSPNTGASSRPRDHAPGLAHRRVRLAVSSCFANGSSSRKLRVEPQPPPRGGRRGRPSRRRRRGRSRRRPRPCRGGGRRSAAVVACENSRVGDEDTARGRRSAVMTRVGDFLRAPARGPRRRSTSHLARSRAPAPLDKSTDRVASGFAGGARDRGDRARASRASGRLPRNLGSTARSLRGHRSPLGRDRARRRVGGEMFLVAREEKVRPWRRVEHTYRACRHACRSRRSPPPPPPAGRLRVRGDVRGLRAARVRRGNRASARVSGSGRGREKRSASPPPPPRPRRVARAVSRGRTSGFRRREGHAPRGGGGTAAAAASAAAPGGGGSRCRQPKTWSWVVVLRKKMRVRTPIRSDGAWCGRDDRARDLDCRESEVLTDAAYVRLFSRRGVAGAVRVECGGRDAGAARSQTLSFSQPKRRTFPPHETARVRGGVENVWLARLRAVFFNHCLLTQLTTFLRTADPRERTPSFPSRGVEARRRGAASSNAGRARLARTPRSHDARRGFGANPGRGDSQAAASRSSSRRAAGG